MTTPEKLKWIVDKYGGIPADFRDLDALTTWQRKLACVLFEYSTEVGDLHKSAKGAEYMRKSAYEKKRLELIAAGKSAAAADAEAKASIDTLAFTEVVSDADYRAAMLQLQAARDVLEAMRQHISSLKEERRIEMAGLTT